MNWLARNPIFYTLVAAILGVAIYGLLRLAGDRARLESLKSEYETKRGQYERYVTARPAPTRANVAMLEANYAELHEEYLQAMEALNLNTYDRDAFFGQTPRTRTDGFFEIAQFVERARRHALRNQVALDVEDRFGFNAYANVGPPADELDLAHRQLKVMAAAVEALFDSGIHALVKVQRGAATADRSLQSAASRGSQLVSEGDIFLLEGSESATYPEIVDSIGIRVAFKGQFAALRNFVNAIAVSRLPFVVRGVEVDLASESGSKAKLETLGESPFAAGDYERFAARASRVPIIAENTSLFVVTLEFLDAKKTFPPPPEIEEADDA